MLTVALLLLSAQDASLFEKAPPDVDEALRARVTQFYQAHVDGKWRAADAVVADDSKDGFLGADKTRCKAFNIVKINYSEEFSKANVLVTCDTELAAAGRRLPVKAPLSSHWKVIDGKWFWYLIPVDPNVGTLTPFGRMKPGVGTDGSGAIGDPLKQGPTALEVLSAIHPDKSSVMLSSYQKSEAVVTLTNTRGRAQLSVEPISIAGLEMSLDATDLKSNESAKLTIRYNPPDQTPKSTQIVRVSVFPSGQVVGIELKFAVPPEIQKLIPKAN
jgi:hypothetical protein